MKIICFSNAKGGCAKSTTALNVAVALAGQGKRVLAVDLDFQGNLSAGLGADVLGLMQMQIPLTSHRLMLGQYKDYTDVVIKNARPRLDLLPATLDSDGDSLLDGVRIGADVLLRDKLSPAAEEYDYCVIDTPPSLKVATINGLAAADMVVIPIDPSYFTVIGVHQVLRSVYRVRTTYNPDMTVYAVLTMFTERQHLDREIREKVYEMFTADLVFSAAIPRLVAVGVATAGLRSVIEVSPESPATLAFRRLVKEIREVMGDGQEDAQGHAQRKSR